MPTPMTESEWKMVRNGCWKARGYTVTLRHAKDGAFFKRPDKTEQVIKGGLRTATTLVQADLDKAGAGVEEIAKFLSDKLLGPDFGKR